MRLRHAVPRSRRGVELAINTVVVLILGVIIVGGGVAMVSVILHEGETIAKEVSQAQMRQLDTLYGQGIGCKFVLECDESCVKFGNRLAAHRSRSVQQKKARTSRFWVISKVVSAEGNLFP